MVGNDHQNQWKQELNRTIRLVSGAFLFGIPLILTMEMWFIGWYVSLWKLVVFIVLAFVVGVTMAYFSSPAGERDLGGSFMQTTNSTGVGIFSALIILVVLNRINLSSPLRAVVGEVAVLTVPLSIGAAASTSILSMNDSENRQGDSNQQDKRSPWSKLANDVGATLAGGIFISLPIAPTREIPRLADGMTYWSELGVLAFSLAITYTIVFVAGFRSSKMNLANRGPFQHPSTETVISYVVSLGIAIVGLYLFGQIQFGDPLGFVVRHVLVLGLPTTIGGAAGRLVI